METFQGRAHMPGTDEEWIFILDIDWQNKQVNVHIEGVSGPISSWPGLVVQTYGEGEIAFRTKGIPPLLTHWWHFVRPNPDTLWGIIIALPDEKGNWTTCPVQLGRVAA
jgi:hypothetical protein